MLRVLVVSLAILSAPAIAQAPMLGVIMPMSTDQEASTRAAVTARLVDPDSARFGLMVGANQFRSPGSMVVCGWVNARNRMGGYNGFMPFRVILTPSQVIFAGLAATNSEATDILDQCSVAGAVLQRR